MAKFRAKKQELERLMTPPSWPEDAKSIPEAVLDAADGDSVSALIALLPRGDLLMWRAAAIAGRVVAKIAENRMDDARVIMRRLIWHLNEDSGNMGWGIALVFGEILAQSPKLAAEYGRIALSYVRDTGFADNYIDHGPLRRDAYWAVGRFAPLYPEYREEGKELLINGLKDEDPQCRGISAWGLGNFAKEGSVSREEKTLLVSLLGKETKNREKCEIMEGVQRYSEPAGFFALQALNCLGASPLV